MPRFFCCKPSVSLRATCDVLHLTSQSPSTPQSIRERYKELVPTPDGHAAVAGEVMIVNMKGFEKNPDGSAGAPLPAIAGGDGVEIILETGT